MNEDSMTTTISCSSCGHPASSHVPRCCAVSNPYAAPPAVCTCGRFVEAPTAAADGALDENRVPLRAGLGGPIVGSATVHPDGTADVEVTDKATFDRLTASGKVVMCPTDTPHPAHFWGADRAEDLVTELLCRKWCIGRSHVWRPSEGGFTRGHQYTGGPIPGGAALPNEGSTRVEMETPAEESTARPLSLCFYGGVHGEHEWSWPLATDDGGVIKLRCPGVAERIVVVDPPNPEVTEAERTAGPTGPSGPMFDWGGMPVMVTEAVPPGGIYVMPHELAERIDAAHRRLMNKASTWTPRGPVQFVPPGASVRRIVGHGAPRLTGGWYARCYCGWEGRMSGPDSESQATALAALHKHIAEEEAAMRVVPEPAEPVDARTVETRRLTLEQYERMPNGDKAAVAAWLDATLEEGHLVDSIRTVGDTWSARGFRTGVYREWFEFTPKIPCPIELPLDEGGDE